MSNDWAASERSPALTTEGRRQLEEKSRSLLQYIISFPSDKSGQTSPSEDARAYEDTLDEFVQLCHTIHSSCSVEEVPNDPGVVLLGDEVVVSAGVAKIHRYLVVHPVEAGLSSGRISSESPLGKALLGRLVGDTVTEDGQTMTILRASRDAPQRGSDA